MANIFTNSRVDHTDHLIHFTKYPDNWTYKDSYILFNKIVADGYLKQGTLYRLGDIPTLCFTEASYAALTEKHKLNKKYFKRYSPFGFMFTKKYIYSMGGLPVIYSPKEHFEKDNDHTNWRTVSYYPLGNAELYRDYTWEREWRIKLPDGRLTLDPQHIQLVFPSKAWAEKFRDDHDAYHQNEDCDCSCTRECRIINYDRYLAQEESEQLKGTCEGPGEFPWILLNMNCEDIPSPA